LPERKRLLRTFGVLALTSLGFGLLAGGASAQTVDDAGGSDLASQFGGFELSASGSGILLTYDIENALPVSPVLSLGLPEAVANQSNSSGYALASLAYPGPLVADLGSALKQGGTDAPIPPYPVRTQAYYPGEQTSQRDQTFPGADMSSITNESSAEASSKYSGISVPGVFQTGAVEVHSKTEITNGAVVSHTRVHQGNIDILGGLIHIGSVVTDISSSSDGTKGTNSGTTNVSEATVLGLAATIDGTGIHLKQGLPPANPITDAAKQATDPLTQGLGQVAEGAAPLTQQLSNLIAQAVGSQKSINDLLLQAGIQVRILSPQGNVDGGAANMQAAGLGINFDYPGASDERFAQVLSLIPSDQLPSQGIPGAGLSPQAIVNLFKEHHISDLSFAPASTSVNATAAFTVDDSAFGTDTGSFGTSVDTGSFGTGDLGATVPSLGTNGGSAPGTGNASLASGFGGGGSAIPIALVLIMIFSSPFWGAASKRFAEATLGGTSAACPDGKDLPPTPPGSAT
jgi:hypothetical protein